MSSINVIENNRIIRESFFQDREIPALYKINPNSDDVLFGFIYCIENMKTGMKYIGAVYSTWQGIKNPDPYLPLRKRATNYIYEYNVGLTKFNTTKNLVARPIIKVMIEDNIENFIMYPIAETTKKNHVWLEQGFITHYDTINNGYNAIPGRGYIYKAGHKMSSIDKQKRSESIICLNLNDKKMIKADSMKLFADHMESTKDMIKNNVRKARPYKGWFMFYVDSEKRYEIISKAIENNKNKTIICLSDKALKFFIELSEEVNTFLTQPNSELFSEFEYTELKYE